jgi:hypothetical protein
MYSYEYFSVLYHVLCKIYIGQQPSLVYKNRRFTEDMALLEVQLDRCREQGHSFEYVNYVPYFEHQGLMLEFQCEHCEFEIFDYIKNKQGADTSNVETIVVKNTQTHSRLAKHGTGIGNTFEDIVKRLLDL